jgi:hypothetical protein
MVVLALRLPGSGLRLAVALPMCTNASEAYMAGGKSVLVCRVAALPLILGGWAAVNAAGAAEKGAPTSVPPNYRQLVASRILQTTDRRKIRRAQISRPQIAWTGLLSGGNRPVVCAVVMRETPLFAEARDCWLFTFQDGRIATAVPSYAACDCAGFSPFNEIVNRK